MSSNSSKRNSKAKAKASSRGSPVAGLSRRNRKRLKLWFLKAGRVYGHERFVKFKKLKESYAGT